ncbi:alpha/beta hydrolase [Peribacillus asahii]|uniref:alpha/beta hydrolase n=1 Tax=Peribacillus asahii TaxID=228899 RepID=UPI003822B383
MKKWWVIIAGILSYVIGIGIYMSNRIMFMKKKEDAFIQNREIEAKRFSVKEFEALPRTELLIPSPEGYSLKCVLIEPHNTKKWIIICHGVTENKINSFKYADMFMKLGFNAVIYDHRRHGESGGKTSSYGHYEKFDLQAVIAEVKKRKGNDIMLGIHGESMGAVTTLLYAGMLEDAADFYIVDCPFSNFEEQIKHQMSQKVPVPSWAVFPIGRAFIKLRDGYWTSEVSPIDYVNNIQKPILFIHSEPDRFIPASMTQALYEQKRGPKQLYLAKKGAHAQSYNENPGEYRVQIKLFLQTYVYDKEEGA